MNLKEKTVAQLEWLHKQIEGTHNADKTILKEIRFELYDRGVDSFHGVPFKILMLNNPALKAEYEGYLQTKNQSGN